MVALLDAGDALADIDDDAGAFMAEDRREEALGIGARQRELIGVADAGRLDLDQHLAVSRTVEVDLHDLQRLSGGDSDSGAGFHQAVPPRQSTEFQVVADLLSLPGEAKCPPALRSDPTPPYRLRR